MPEPSNRSNVITGNMYEPADLPGSRDLYIILPFLGNCIAIYSLCTFLSLIVTSELACGYLRRSKGLPQHLIYAQHVRADWAFYTTACSIAIRLLGLRKDYMLLTARLNIAFINS